MEAKSAIARLILVEWISKPEQLTYLAGTQKIELKTSSLIKQSCYFLLYVNEAIKNITFHSIPNI